MLALKVRCTAACVRVSSDRCGFGDSLLLSVPAVQRWLAAPVVDCQMTVSHQSEKAEPGRDETATGGKRKLNSAT